MSADDDDYMSDKILQQMEDVRPGLPMKRTQQRDIQMAKRKAEKNAMNRTKKIHVIEDERRKEGLAKPIDESNKGFVLLSKMGFKPGSSIGSSQQSNAEPIELKLKTDGRGGLGMALKNEEEAKQRIQRHLDEAIKRDCSKMTNEFRRDKRNVFDERTLRADLRRSQRVCRQLEMEIGKKKADKKSFWPPLDEDETADGDEDEDEDVIDEAQLLAELTDHLRNEYFYCIWCGCKYDNVDDLQQCPGNNRQAHDD